MNILFRKYLTVLLVALLLVSGAAIDVKAQNASIPGMELVSENSELALYANMTDGEFALLSKSDGFIWWSNPVDRENENFANDIKKNEINSQLVVQCLQTLTNSTDTASSYADSVVKEAVTVKKTGDGFRADYKFLDQGIAIPLRYTLMNDYLKVELLVDEIREAQDKSTLIANISLLPFLGAGGMSESGYMVVPDGSGAVINFNNGKQMFESYNARIYGKDITFSDKYSANFREEARLPVYGIVKGNNAMLAVAHKGDVLGTVNALVSGKLTGYNNVFFSFTIREKDIYDISKDKQAEIYDQGELRINTCEVRYYPLQGSEMSYKDLASRYRKYLVDEKGVRPVNNIENALYLDIYGAIKKKKSFLGIPFDVTTPLTTYTECVEIVDSLKKSGIDNIILRYDNWNLDGVARKIPSGVRIEKVLGNKKDFNMMLSFFMQNHISFYPNVEIINYSKSGNGYSVWTDSTMRLNRSYATQYFYWLSAYQYRTDIPGWSILKPFKLDSAFDTLINSFKKYSLTKISIGSIGTKLYSDYSKNRFNRQMSEDMYLKCLDNTKKQVEGILTDGANAYTFPYADHIMNVPTDSSHYNIEDESIPFYQMVIHGLIPYSIRPINESSDPETLFLKAIETGSMLQYQWIFRDPALVKASNFDYLYGSGFNQWFDDAVLKYKELNQVFSKVSNKMITNHRKIKDGVFETEYENGVRIIVNYNSSPVSVYGKAIMADNYIVVERGE